MQLVFEDSNNSGIFRLRKEDASLKGDGMQIMMQKLGVSVSFSMGSGTRFLLGYPSRKTCY